MQLLTSMSTRGKITLGACALAFLLAAMMIVKMAGKPSYATIQTGIDPAQASKVTAALDQQGIGWELQNGGTALAVDKGKTTQARIALASQGLNTSSQPGFELLDKQKLGASNQQQQIAYQRGLEGEIANTISQIPGAEGSTVRLSLAKDDLFADEQRSATAAVLLGGASATLEGGAVKGIANLVASSVPGLKTSAVTITDNSGQLVWPSGDGAGGGDDTGGLASKLSAESKYNSTLSSSLNAMLTRTLGADKAQVQVTSDLNVDRSTEESLEYGDKTVALSEKTETETLKGDGAAAAGTSGAANNIPAYAGSTTTGAGTSDYTSEKSDVQNGVDKKVIKTSVAPGRVNKLSVAVLVDRNAKPDIPALTSAIQTAVGYDKARGDQVSVTAVPFAKVAESKAPSSGLPIPPAFSGILKGLGIGIGALMFLFFVTRHLRKRESETLMDEPSWLRELEAARPAPALLEMPAGGGDVPLTSIANADPRRQQLDQLISNEPERVAAHLRTWITEDDSR